mmetsp:Transcript_31779/g.30301  ORF Transcript_31779/g.30301 Transcript_31779/m.30301 type:complete len:1026 (+) Transcript_31779:155-3232(+)
MRSTEYTPLCAPKRVVKYDPLRTYTEGDAILDNSGSTTVHLMPSGNKHSWKSNAVRVAAVTMLVLSTCAVLLSFQSPPTDVDVPVFPKRNDDTPKGPSRPVSPPKDNGPLPRQGAAWSSIAQPLSILDPESLGIIGIDRPEVSMPGLIFGELLEKHVPLPTNRVYQLPYVIDTETHGNMSTQGVETHPCHVQANEKMVEMIYQARNGIHLGANETFLPQHQVSADTDLALGRLSTVLEWKSQEYVDSQTGPFMKTAIVRGSPYTSMEYKDTTPKILLQRTITMAPVLDDNENNTLICGDGDGVFGEPKMAREVRIHFDVSDFTYLIFFSEPTEIYCSNKPEPPAIFYGLGVPPPANEPHGKFEIQTTQPMKVGMVRVALANNCTMGRNPEYCIALGTARDNSQYMELLRDHSDVYPTGKADVRFTFPVESAEEEELRLDFSWEPKLMSSLHNGGDDDATSLTPMIGIPPVELLMFAIPHQQERMLPTGTSSNTVHQIGCTPTLHGSACPVSGGHWSMLEHLHKVSFTADRTSRPEMIEDIQSALQTDIMYEIPGNYMRGAGDTYFSGKMLSKLARIVLIAKEVGGVEPHQVNNAVDRLKAGVEIWLNGSAESPLLYDKTWGGIVMCGCDYDSEIDGCLNKFPDCPALTDQGSNFGAGFYNDHHFHFGYHIYAAAVAAKYDNNWGRKFHERILLLVRDIANPSGTDPYFPAFRHKDWYLGFSWASGVVTIGGKPYPNGRNEESSSESISAYEAVALYGEVAAELYEGTADEGSMAYYDNALRLRDMGRLLLATEVRSAKTYWHVQAPQTEGVSRIYPDVYKPKVVGMMWSMLAQEQTWFGNEVWKSYGIQMIPITPASELRDDPKWMEEMLPLFQESCFADEDCIAQGWSLLIFAGHAEIGNWKGAWKGVNAVNESVFSQAGGNGQSRSNSLWYVSTRPDYTPTKHYPTTKPSKAPISNPTKKPVSNPTKKPSSNPTLHPTRKPVSNPTLRPTAHKTLYPTYKYHDKTLYPTYKYDNHDGKKKPHH